MKTISQNYKTTNSNHLHTQEDILKLGNRELAFKTLLYLRLALY